MERVERERWDSNPGTTHDAPRVCDSVTLLNCKRPSGSHDRTLCLHFNCFSDYLIAKKMEFLISSQPTCATFFSFRNVQ